MNKTLRRYIWVLGVVVGLSGIFGVSSETAKAANGEYYLQVSPSPLVVTIKPGQTETFDLKIRNAGTEVENLTIAPRSFEIDNASGEVKFDDSKKPPEIGDWVSFSQQNFTVKPGEWFTQKITMAIPKEAGFSYSFAFLITRQENQVSQSSGRELKGSVAIFSLVNIDKPGATRALQLERLSTSQPIYEYLPTKINVQLKNTGNSIVRPDGNVFMQRGASDSEPITTLDVNPTDGYILPGSTRTLSLDWNEGYPATKTSTDSTGKAKVEEDWNLANLSKLRFGQYTAKLVAVYNDGQRDIPVYGEVSFWVIPWKFLLVVIVVLGLIGVGIWSIAGKFFKTGRKKHKGAVKFRR